MDVRKEKTLAIRPVTSVQERVIEGAKFMDQHFSGWSEDVNPLTTNMFSDTHVLCQATGLDLTGSLNSLVHRSLLPHGEAGYSRAEELGLLLYRPSDSEVVEFNKLWWVEAFKRNFPKRWEAMAKELA